MFLILSKLIKLNIYLKKKNILKKVIKKKIIYKKKQRKKKKKKLNYKNGYENLSFLYTLITR